MSQRKGEGLAGEYSVDEPPGDHRIIESQVDRPDRLGSHG